MFDNAATHFVPLLGGGDLPIFSLSKGNLTMKNVKFTTKIAAFAVMGAALSMAPAMAQTTAPATPPVEAPATPPVQAPVTPELPADAVSVKGKVAAVSAEGSYTLSVSTVDGAARDIAVDASAAADSGTFAVGDEVLVTGTLDAQQTKLTAISIVKADAVDMPAEKPAAEPMN